MNFASIPLMLRPKETKTMAESKTFTNSLKNSIPSLKILKKISTQKKTRRAKLTYLKSSLRMIKEG